MNPMNEAWKYRIKKFQKIVLLTFRKSSRTFGLFLDNKMHSAKTNTAKMIPIAERATPSRLW